MEGSFADAATHHGFKRARWRRLWRQQIQDYLIATAQNLRTLIRYTRRPLMPVIAQVLNSTVATGMGTIGALQVVLAFAWVTRLRSSVASELTS